MSVATKEINKSLPPKYKAVVSALREGKENATLLSDIMMIADIQDRRQAYQIIEDLIIKYGYCIAGNKKGEFKGYYLITNKSELKETLGSLNTTIQSLMKRHKMLLLNYNRTDQ